MGSQLSRMTSASTLYALVQEPKASITSSAPIHFLLQRLCLGPDSIQPFPFLRLPPELRLIVYESLSLEIIAEQHFIDLSDLKAYPSLDLLWPSYRWSSHISLIRKSSPDIYLLYTCRQIYTEAYPVFAPLLRELAMEPLRFSAMGHAAAIALTCAPTPLVTCIGGRLEDTLLVSNLTRQARKFISLCRRPSPTFTTGDVDIEISFMPSIDAPAESLEMVDKALQGIADCAAEGALRYRVFMTPPVRLQGPVRFPAAITDVADKVEVRQLSFSQYIRHFLEQQAIVRG